MEKIPDCEIIASGDNIYSAHQHFDGLVPHAEKDPKDYTLVLAPAQFEFKVEKDTIVYNQNIELIKAFIGFYTGERIENGKTYEYKIKAEKGSEKAEEKVKVKVEKNKITFINERQS